MCSYEDMKFWQKISYENDVKNLTRELGIKKLSNYPEFFLVAIGFIWPRKVPGRNILEHVDAVDVISWAPFKIVYIFTS